MCFHTSQVIPYQRWHWAGDEIVPEPVVPAARSVPGARKRGYPIDIREFLSITDNAVVRHRLGKIVDALSLEEQRLFRSRGPGAFDFRVSVIVREFGKLDYVPSKRRTADSWLFPDETLAQGGGDCEDLAFLLAALLDAAQVSRYCVRVALGRVVVRDGAKKPHESDHAWVVYLNEGGAWEILEPLVHVRAPRGKQEKKTASKAKLERRTVVEYVPHFVFNQEHLWRVRSADDQATLRFDRYLADREFWAAFDPTFATSVHNGIYDDALKGMSAGDLSIVKRVSLVTDANVLGYDPRDHFDFAYIDEGWQRVQSRLATRDLADFARAAHAIADFYAHSTYYDFGARRGNAQTLVPYDPNHPNLSSEPSYDFERYAPLPGATLNPAEAAAKWNGKLISGQWWRWFTTYPSSLRPALPLRRCLPDHDAIAVDSADRPAYQRRYDEAEYQFAFADRRQAAVEHIRAAFAAWRR